MTALTMAQVRRDARTRLIMMAEGHRAYRGPYDPDRIGGTGIDLVWRWARSLAHQFAGCPNGFHHEPECLRVQTATDLLLPVAKGNAVEMYDAVQAGGIGALLGEDEPPPPTIDELEAALTRMLGVSADG